MIIQDLPSYQSIIYSLFCEERKILSVKYEKPVDLMKVPTEIKINSI